MKCSKCGTCCKLFAVNLSEKEYKSKKYKADFYLKDFQEAELRAANILKRKKDRSCCYLKDNKCSIHDRRPEVCRNFFCDSKKTKYKEMILTIQSSKLA